MKGCRRAVGVAPRLIFIPRSYIGKAEEDNRRTTLSLSKADLDAFDWSRPPEPWGRDGLRRGAP